MAVTIGCENIYSFFVRKVDTSYNMLFKINNWNEFSLEHNYYLKKFADSNGAIWLSSKGEITYRISLNSNIHTVTLHNMSLILSNFLQMQIYVVLEYRQKAIPKNKPIGINHNIPQIPIRDLILIEDDIFDPLQFSEFFRSDKNGLIYRNTFLPSSYLLNQPKLNQILPYSIILQYVYYLTNYNKNRFCFIMNWLAAFFKDFKNKSKTALVLFGSKKSGKEILFDEIIKPLFGKEYCLKITDTILEDTFVQKLLKNKLFYNIDNISASTIKNKKIISNLLSKDTIEIIENREFIAEYPKYGQTIITIDEAYLPYLDKDFESYTLFKIPEDIEQIHIPQELRSRQINNDIMNDTNLKKSQNKKISKLELIEAIRADLENFALILKGYSIDIGNLNLPFNDDDKKNLQLSLEDKVREFHNAILNYKNNIKYFEKINNKTEENLYDMLISDFEINRIKQSNLIKYFQAIYSEEKNLSKRSLMSKLRKVDEKFYDVSNIKSKSGGKKYFELSYL